MPLQLGFVSAIFPELSLDAVLAFAAAEGFACVELMCWPVGAAERKYAGVTHVDVTSFTPAMADDIRAACERHGFVWGGKWLHFDTMHFEFRPELLHPACRAGGPTSAP